jgi:hypothetical protein
MTFVMPSDRPSRGAQSVGYQRGDVQEPGGCRNGNSPQCRATAAEPGDAVRDFWSPLGQGSLASQLSISNVPPSPERAIQLSCVRVHQLDVRGRRSPSARRARSSLRRSSRRRTTLTSSRTICGTSRSCRLVRVAWSGCVKVRSTYLRAHERVRSHSGCFGVFSSRC